MKTLPVVKCTVSTDEKEVDVSRWIDEYDMLETLLSRDKTSGVLATVTFPVNFVSYAKDYVKSLFEKDGLYTKARFNVYLREDYGVNYNLVKSTALDFGTYKEETERVTVECAEEELSQLINSEGKTKYEILVDKDIKSDKQWNYQRMELVNTISYAIPDTIIENIDYQLIRPLVDFSNAEMVLGSPTHDVKKQSLGKNTNDYLFKAEQDVNLNIFGKFVITATAKYRPNISKPICLVIKLAIKRGNDIISSWEKAMHATTEIRQEANPDDPLRPILYIMAEYSQNVNFDNLNFSLKSGDEIVFYLENGYEPITEKIIIEKCEFFNLRYKSKSSNNAKIDIINPIKLMQKYLNQMSGKDNYFSVDIQWQEKDYKTRIVAAESIRQIPDAKIYGSPRDFLEWMKVLGYEYECIDRKLIFKPRDEFFKRNISAMGLRAHELADLIVQADQTYAYTSVEIGYDKQNYESINGRCEANGTFCYTTGFIARKDNKLSLISPYRADSMGIEFLCQETDKKSTDTKSDKDVFFVALNENGDFYTEYKGIEIIDKELGIKMFNAPFNPYFLIQRNESLIGINAQQVKFKSTDMSGTADITNVTKDKGIYSDQQITKKLFEPIEYNFAAGHWQKIPVPEKRNGLIYFEWQGEILKGFIKEIRKNYACETETTWILWAVK